MKLFEVEASAVTDIVSRQAFRPPEIAEIAFSSERTSHRRSCK